MEVVVDELPVKPIVVAGEDGFGVSTHHLEPVVKDTHRKDGVWKSKMLFSGESRDGQSFWHPLI